MLKAEVAFLDEVEQFHARRQGVAAGDAHDESQVGPDEPVLGRFGVADCSVEITTFFAGLLASSGLEALLDNLAQLALFLGVQEGDGADFVQVLSNRIAHDKLIQGKSAQGGSEAVGFGGEVGTVSALLADARIAAVQPTYCAHKVTPVKNRSRDMCHHSDASRWPSATGADLAQSPVGAPHRAQRIGAYARCDVKQVGRQVGVFGGTFDPPHVGHLAIALEVRHTLALDEVWFVVAGDPWQKSEERSITPASIRLAMVEAAVAGFPECRSRR